MNELLQEIINAVLPILVGGAVMYATYLGTKFKTWIHTKITNEQLVTINNVVDASVKWVEQVTGNDLVATSEEKLEMALNFTKERLNKFGIHLEDDDLVRIIEAFVNQLGGDK